MKNILFILSVFLFSYSGVAQENLSIIKEGAKVKLLADGFSFTEGPAVDSEGNVYFTDQPNDRIHKWSVDGRLTTFKEKAGRANGLYLDKQGRIISCSDAKNELWRIDMNGNHQVLISNEEGERLNGPNDLWIRPDGGIYFTDPLYKRDYWTRNPEMQRKGEFVYYLSPGGKYRVMASDLEKPNGIVGTPDGKKLYVADIKANKTYVYDIKKNGKLVNKRLFAPLGSDGMTIDVEGNIYLTGKGVTVFNSKGKQIEYIPIDANWTANVCFGGKDMKTLFITASQYLYSLEMNVSGVR